MASIAALNRGDQVLSKLFGGPIMTVLAVEGLKVRCEDGLNQQYWFDTIMLERYQGEAEDWNNSGARNDVSGWNAGVGIPPG